MKEGRGAREWMMYKWRRRWKESWRVDCTCGRRRWKGELVSVYMEEGKQCTHRGRRLSPRGS